MKEQIKKICNRWFITAFSGMASGLFCTLIAGTIVALIASWVGDNMLGYFLSTFATLAKILMGAGIGIGIAYNVIISTVSAWFPDKKGFCTGSLMMGFGASSLLLGNFADVLFKTELGRKGTYIILGK